MKQVFESALQYFKQITKKQMIAILIAIFTIIFIFLPLTVKEDTIANLPDGLKFLAPIIQYSIISTGSHTKSSKADKTRVLKACAEIVPMSELWTSYNLGNKNKNTPKFQMLSERMQTHEDLLDVTVKSLLEDLRLNRLVIDKTHEAYALYNIAWYYFLKADLKSDIENIYHAKQAISLLRAYRSQVALSELNRTWVLENNFVRNSKLLEMQIYATNYYLNPTAANKKELFNILFNMTIAEMGINEDAHYKPYYNEFIQKLYKQELYKQVAEKK